MRVIEQDLIKALREERNFHAGSGRDRVEWDGKEFCVVLWGNYIAKGNTETETIRVSSCGWSTPTTTSRLNAVFAAFGLPLSAVIRKGELKFLRDGTEEINPGTKTEAGGWIVTVV